MKDKYGEQYPDAPAAHGQFIGPAAPYVVAMMRRIGKREAVVARTDPLTYRTTLFFIERNPGPSGLVAFAMGEVGLTMKPSHAINRWLPVKFPILIAHTVDQYAAQYPDAPPLIVAPDDNNTYRNVRGED